ncbi:MAG: BtpA/SgcQ family protein [Phycisphaerales bacterium]|nr:BtpA/SgcQ family protein [Phycisphaerales bacterium]
MSTKLKPWLPLNSKSRAGTSPKLVGMVHVQPLPGTPMSAGGGSVGVDRIAQLAAQEARILADTGFDAIIVENMHDRPYVHAGVDGHHGPEIVSAMTRCVLAVKDAVGDALPIGIQVLSGGNREALAIALATGARFIRCENFVFAHVADEGLLARAEAGELLRYRRMIGAEHIQIFCDLKKKHASHAITADVSLSDAAEAAEFFGADGLIVTGTATGKATSPGDVKEVRTSSALPLLVGSGVTPNSARELIDAGADALIVGSWIKRGGTWTAPIDPKRCREMRKATT